MGGLFGGGPDPQPQAAPTPPTIDPVQQEQAKDVDKQKRVALMNAGGRASTVLTGGLGDTSTPTTASKVLLGS